MKDNLENCGIYKIENCINKKCYIGSSKNILIRKSKHLSWLRNNKHQNTYLQNAWNKYGEDNFTFEVIEYCKDESILAIKEQHWINILNSQYNITKQVIRNIPSETSKIKHSKTKKIMYAEGRLDHIKKEGRIILQYDLQGNFIKEWKNSVYASKSLNISVSTILRCCNKMYKTGRDFIWKYSDDNSDINLDLSRKEILKNSKSKTVILTNINTNEKLIFESVTIAAKYFGVSYSNFRQYYNKRFNFKKIYKIDLVKSDKLLETPEEDNQQPIINLND